MRYRYLLLIVVVFLTGCIPEENDATNKDEYSETEKQITNNPTAENRYIMPNTMPKDFNIIFEYGVNQAKQHDSINTIDNVISKDLVLDGLATSELNLNQDNLEAIYDELYKVNIIEYPRSFMPPYKDNPEPGIKVLSTPSMEYRLNIYYNEVEYSLYWHDSNCSESEKAVILRNSFNQIISIIYNTTEYQLFPESNGGYD